MKCKICGKEFSDVNRRAFNAHCVREHRREYFGKTLEEMSDDPIPARAHDLREAAKKKKKPTTKKRIPIRKTVKPARPAGFRLLCEGNDDEAYAIEQGYTYIDKAQDCYTSEEAEKLGWV